MTGTNPDIAVVTGGARGIGLAIGRRLARDGRHVVLADLDGAEAQAAAFRAEGLAATGCVVDVADEGSMEMLADTAMSLGRLSVWVNNAGVAGRCALLDLSLAEWNRVMGINVTGAFLGTRAAARRMGEGGAIVNLASLTSFGALPALAHYAASKAAVAMFTKSAALDLADRGIRVNAVAPGMIETSMTAPRLSEAAEVERSFRRMMIKRLGQPDDVAAAVAFLCSADASYLTGVVLPCDGGWSAAA